MARPKPSETMTQVTLYLPQEDWRQFRAACIQHGVSASSVLALAIKRGLLDISAATQSPEDCEATHA